MQFKKTAQKIINLKEADLNLRNQLLQKGTLHQGYNATMAALHNKNAETLNDIIDSIGYPTIDKVGKEASEAAWLIIQHSIGQPDFMKKCVRLLENEVWETDVSPTALAYLSDRIAVFEGKPQRYGTQFDWDENGELSPQGFDDLAKVNQRRKAVGLNTVEAQTEIMRRRAEEENEGAPVDFEKRKKEFDKWRRSVGWIK